MLFRERYWPGLADGSITVAFRRWKRPTVKAGGTLQSPIGLLAIDAVAQVSERDITTADARLAGFASRADLLSELQEHEGTLYRIDFHMTGPDPRIALRENDALSTDAIAALKGRLARLDKASADGPWTLAVLHLIAQMPETRAADLAKTIGEPDLARFKTRVRRLKNLGLTESLVIGYRLSPRGVALLSAIDATS